MVSSKTLPKLVQRTTFLIFLLSLLLWPTHIEAKAQKIIAPKTKVEDKDTPPYIAGEVLVKFKEDPQFRPATDIEQTVLGEPPIKADRDSLNRLSREVAIITADKLTKTNAPFYKFGIETDVMEAVAKFKTDTAVEYAEPNYIVRPLWAPNDAYYQYQWNFKQIKSETGWNISGGGRSQIVVAIIDSGIAYQNFSDPHPALCADSSGYYECVAPGMFYAKAPDFSQTTFVSGYDFINSDAHPNDDDGHGTHVAGTVAESTNNISKSAGLAFNVSIMPIKVLAAMGSGGDTAKAASGIDYAREHGADVINLSLGSDYDSQVMREAIQRAVNAGIIITAATGNESTRSSKADVIYPAAYAGVIAVGATRVDEMRADYSNYGSALDIMAPGGQMINDEWTWFQDQDGDSLPDGIVQETLDPNPTQGSAVLSTKRDIIGLPQTNAAFLKEHRWPPLI